MNFLKHIRTTMGAVLISMTTISTHAAGIYYSIGAANSGQGGPLQPNYLDGSESMIAASTLQATGLTAANEFGQQQTGTFTFEIGPGQTLYIRFVARYPAAPRFGGAAGFVHVYPFNWDLSIDMSQVLRPPMITHQPISQFCSLGSTVSFTVNASGTSPLSYQWFFKGASVEGATNSTMLITYAGTSNVGSYFVVVANIVDVAISQPASLWLNDISKCARVIDVYGPLGGTMLVKYTTNLEPPVQWTTLASVIITNLPTRVIDSGSPEAEIRYYTTLPQQ